MALPPIRQLLVESLTLPRSAARRVLAARLPARVSLSVLFAALSLGSVLGSLLQILSPTQLNPVTAFLTHQPILATLIQLLLWLGVVGLIVLVGRGLGGRGHPGDALALIAVLHVVLLVIQVVQVVVFLALPVLGALLSLLALGWLGWALTAFITELHGFRSELKVFAGLFISFMVVLVCVAILMALLGLSLPELA